MNKRATTKKQVVESESASDSDNDSDNGEQLLVGQGDAIGGFDNSKFQEDNTEKKKKTNNIVRK
jgi:hypothetical protein